MRVFSGGFWILIVVYAAVIDRVLAYVPAIPYLSPLLGVSAGGAFPTKGTTLTIGLLQQSMGVIVLAGIFAWLTPKLF